MKKQILSLLTVLPAIGFAQITLDSADIIPKVGDTTGYYTMKNAHTIGAIAAAGTGASWDYSTMTKEDSTVVEFEAPVTGGFRRDPANTTIAEQYSGFTGNRIQYNATKNSLYIMGTRNGITQTSYGKDSLLKFKFPVKYNDSFTTTINSESGNIVKTYRKGSYKVTADGSGKLILPYGTLKNLIRIKIEMKYRDSSRFTQSDYSSTAYEYWQKGSVSYVMKIDFVDDDGSTDTTVVYRKPGEVKHDPTGLISYSWSPSIKLYPNPASGVLNVESLELSNTSKYKIFNILGEAKLVGDFANGNQINIEELSTGLYFIEFDGINTQPIRFIKE